MGKLIFDQKERVGHWVAGKVEQSASWGDYYAMGVERDGEITAGVVFNNYNGSNCTVHIAIDKPGKDVYRLFHHVCKYAFLHCGLRRITGLVDTAKPDVISFDKKLGFEEEFLMKCAGPDGGDLQVLVMWPDKCRWLEEKYA